MSEKFRTDVCRLRCTRATRTQKSLGENDQPESHPTCAHVDVHICALAYRNSTVHANAWPPTAVCLKRLLCSSPSAQLRLYAGPSVACHWSPCVFSHSRPVPIKPECAMARRQSEVWVRAVRWFLLVGDLVFGRSVDRSIGQSVGRSVVCLFVCLFVHSVRDNHRLMKTLVTIVTTTKFVS